MSKKSILIIICLLVLTGCSKSNQLEVNNKKIKDTLICHGTEALNNELVNLEVHLNFDKNNKWISINYIEDWDYSKTPYNIEVLNKGIGEKIINVSIVRQM